MSYTEDISASLSGASRNNVAEQAGASDIAMEELLSNQESCIDSQHSGLDCFLSKMHYTVIACCRKMMQSKSSSFCIMDYLSIVNGIFSIKSKRGNFRKHLQSWDRSIIKLGLTQFYIRPRHRPERQKSDCLVYYLKSLKLQL